MKSKSINDLLRDYRIAVSNNVTCKVGGQAEGRFKAQRSMYKIEKEIIKRAGNKEMIK